MPLSREAQLRFVAYAEHTDPANTNPDDDEALLDFVAWALVHDPDALKEPFAFEGIMSGRHLTDNKMRYVHTIIRAALPLVAAYARERGEALG